MVADETPLENEETRKAVELLVEAVAKEIKPGVLELKLAASFLRELLDDPSQRAFNRAVQAFDAIDKDIRLRIQASVRSAAMVYRTKSGHTVTVPKAVATRELATQASGLLQALNFGGARQTPGKTDRRN